MDQTVKYRKNAEGKVVRVVEQEELVDRPELVRAVAASNKLVETLNLELEAAKRAVVKVEQKLARAKGQLKGNESAVRDYDAAANFRPSEPAEGDESGDDGSEGPEVAAAPMDAPRPAKRGNRPAPAPIRDDSADDEDSEDEDELDELDDDDDLEDEDSEEATPESDDEGEDADDDDTDDDDDSDSDEDEDDDALSDFAGDDEDEVDETPAYEPATPTPRPKRPATKVPVHEDEVSEKDF